MPAFSWLTRHSFLPRPSIGANSPPARHGLCPSLYYQHDYVPRSGRPRSGRLPTFRYLTHQSPFAATRWTNLYFPTTFGVFGDVIGGPLVNVFGQWISDRPVRWGESRLRNLTLVSHTSYWALPKSPDTAAWSHIRALREALDLNRRRDLEELAQAVPPEIWVDAES